MTDCHREGAIGVEGTTLHTCPSPNVNLDQIRELVYFNQVCCQLEIFLFNESSIVFSAGPCLMPISAPNFKNLMSNFGVH